jgi:hypothetical protein
MRETWKKEADSIDEGNISSREILPSISVMESILETGR